MCLSQNGPNWLNLSSDGAAKIGDSIGGITAPFVGVLAVLTTFGAFWAQYEYNRRQYMFTIKEQFDHAFYEMLSIHENITDSLGLAVVNATPQTEIMSTQSEEAVKMRRAVFSYMYEDMTVYENEKVGRFTFVNRKQYVGLKGLFEGHEDPYPIYETNREVSGLDHYFRQLYNIFKMIKENNDLDEDTKYYYASIARSTLSQYELVMLFHNCLSAHGRDKFKPLIEEYALLKNIRMDLLASTASLEQYANTAYKRN